VLLELDINRHKEHINIAATNLNGMNIFLRYKWLVKHNPKLNCNTKTIWFTRCLKECRTQYQNILFISRTRRLQPINNQNKEQQNIGK